MRLVSRLGSMIVVLGIASCTGRPAPTPAPSNPSRPAESAQDYEREATITGPTVIGFFPPISERDREEDDGGLREGLAQVGLALEDLKECLAPRKIDIELRIARALEIKDGAAMHRLEFPSDWQHAIGIVLVEPGREPGVVNTETGPSALLMLAPQAAWKYFSEPDCKRYEE